MRKVPIPSEVMRLANSPGWSKLIEYLETVILVPATTSVLSSVEFDDMDQIRRNAGKRQASLMFIGELKRIGEESGKI